MLSYSSAHSLQAPTEILTASLELRVSHSLFEKDMPFTAKWPLFAWGETCAYLLFM